jgi:hypothetical protein
MINIEEKIPVLNVLRGWPEIGPEGGVLLTPYVP